MRKTILLFLSCFLWQVTVMRATDVDDIDNVIYISPLTAAAGSTSVQLSICMKNSVPIRGFQFKLYLPDGVNAHKNANGKIIPKLVSERLGEDDVHTIQVSEHDGYLLVTSSSEAIENFLGNDGPVATLEVDISPSIAEGAHTVELREIKLSETDISKYYETELLESTLTIDGVDDGRIHFDETSSNLPRYTAGEKGNVTMKRTIKKNVWNTIVLPFNLTRANAKKCFGDNVQFAKFNGFEVDYGDDEENVTPLGILIKFDEYTIPARGNLEGGTLVLIKTDQDITEIKLDGVTLTEGVLTEEKADEYGTTGKFTGSLVKTVVPADGLFISDNKFWYSTGKTNIKAFRGWFELGAVLGKDTDFGAKVRFVIDDAPTAIEGIESANVDGDVYTLQGIYVGRDVEKNRLPKGIYIIDGKKTFVK